MVASFRIISNEQDDFLRDITIDGNCTFLQLHKFIQDDLNFDDSQMASFFLTDQDWNKEQEITLFDMTPDSGSEIKTMDSVKVEEVISEEKQRLLYVFDIFSERSLFIECYLIDPAKEENTLCLNKSMGEAPEQISLQDLFSDDDLDMVGGNVPQEDIDLESLNDFKDDNDFLSYTDDLESYN